MYIIKDYFKEKTNVQDSFVLLFNHKLLLMISLCLFIITILKGMAMVIGWYQTKIKSLKLNFR